jgi:hypothetical protein
MTEPVQSQRTQLRVIAFLLAGMLVGLSLVASGTIVDSVYVHHNDASPPGVPISDSPFADLAREPTDPVYGRILSEQPLLIAFHVPQPHLGQNQALAIAAAFLEPHLPANESLTLEQAWLCLPDWAQYAIPPRWVLMFTNFTLTIDAVTGTIWMYKNGFASSTNGNESSTIPESEAQSRACAFLRLHNISLPANAYYLGAKSYAAYGLPEYWITFIHVEAQAIIHEDELRIIVNLVTGEVSSYNRCWIGLPAVSTTGILAGNYVASQVVASLENASAYSVDAVLLKLTCEPNLSQDQFVLRLCWVTTLRDKAHGYLLADVVNDAFSGEYLGMNYYAAGGGSPPRLVNGYAGLDIGVLGLAAACLVAAAAYLAIRRRAARNTPVR